MNHVFISYVHEDLPVVSVLKVLLESGGGIKLWLDRDNLDPGQRWKDSIRKAIKDGTYFFACFSDNYTKKDSSYMNEELVVAIEQLRQKPHYKSWFIPIRLSNCEIPDRSIGAGETLNDLQRVDLFDDFETGVNTLLKLLAPTLSPQRFSDAILKANLTHHIQNKIKHFINVGAPRYKEIESKWLSLLETNLLEVLSKSFFELRERSKSTGKPQMDRIMIGGESGSVILMSVAPFIDITKLISELTVNQNGGGEPYTTFILNHRKDFRRFPNWENRDFVHLLFLEEEEETLFDMLYVIDYQLDLELLVQSMEKQKSNGPIFHSYEYIYPTSVINSIEASKMVHLMGKEDAKNTNHPESEFGE